MMWLGVLACSRPTTQTPAPAPAQALAKPQGQTCEVRAYVGAGVGPNELFDNPGGTVVGSHAVLDPLEGGISAGPILSLTRRSKNGAWFHVGAVQDYTLAEGTPPRGPDQGWIRGTGLEVDLAMSEVSPALMPPPPIHLRAQPSESAPVVRTYHQEDHRAALLDCKGSWVKVRVEVEADKTVAEGWLAPGDHCGHPFTTCG